MNHMNTSTLFDYILSDEYWLQEAVEHFVLTAPGHRLEDVEDSYNETHPE